MCKIEWSHLFFSASPDCTCLLPAAGSDVAEGTQSLGKGPARV